MNFLKSAWYRLGAALTVRVVWPVRGAIASLQTVDGPTPFPVREDSYELVLPGRSLIRFEGNSFVRAPDGISIAPTNDETADLLAGWAQDTDTISKAMECGAESRRLRKNELARERYAVRKLREQHGVRIRRPKVGKKRAVRPKKRK